MKIELHPNFKKSYQKRITNKPKLVRQTQSRTKLFQKDPNNPTLRSHNLKGKKLNLKAFSITGDIRIVYFPISKDHVIFLDTGTHNQIY